MALPGAQLSDTNLHKGAVLAAGIISSISARVSDTGRASLNSICKLKAMIAALARTQAHAVGAQEEETAKDPATRVHRRADLMVTCPRRRKVAFEVEYKQYSPEEWRAKHGEYAGLGIGCVWLFRHLPRYLAQPRPPEGWPDTDACDRAKWRELRRQVARSGLPVLFINPIERSIGTLIEHRRRRARSSWQRPGNVSPRLAIPPLFGDGASGSCRPNRFLSVGRRSWPDHANHAMDPKQRAFVDAAADADRTECERLRAQQERRRYVQAEREATVQKRASTRTTEERRLFAEQRRADDRQKWHASALRAQIKHELRQIPDFLAMQLEHDRGVHAHPTHWHCQLFEDLVRGRIGDSHLGHAKPSRPIGNTRNTSTTKCVPEPFAAAAHT
jgi:hypothetical protein